MSTESATPSTDYSDLIAKLGKAGGPDRELDCLIWAQPWRPMSIHSSSPYYTASIDATMTLLPEGWFLQGLGEHRTLVRYRGDKHEPINWRAELQWVDGGGRLIHANEATPALALLIAILRAREEMEKLE